MPVICPTCSRANPSNAAYCYYDGRGLIQAALNGPLGLGTRPFPMPFSFSDGQGCTDFNQLVLACDQRWNEARGYLNNGIWKSFFGAIGRADLASLAMRAANEADPDVGLCRLLEALPADAEALRPAKLTLPTTIEDLGELEPGKDYKLQLVIENQGILLLRGSASTECDWLALGDRKGLAAEKIFQTRDTYSLTVQVLGSKLHAGKLPLEGQIVIDTNGGRETVTVRATVPIRPFPQMPDGNGALAGATSPREIAFKAKEHPKEAAVLFEQGAVKVWYESNGWTYPIRTTQARGKSALQQFFEALGLSKPPRLEIDTQQIVCQGEAGKHLVKTVIVRTTESKYVHAEVFSHEDWVKVKSTEPHGNSVNILLRIDVPPRPGETLDASVVVIGNGQQRFVVPVQLTITGTIPPPPPPPEQQQAASPFRWLPWALAGCGGVFLVCLVLGGTLFFFLSRRHADTPTRPADETKTVENQPEGTGVGLADSPLGKLRRAALDQRSIFDLLESTQETDREKGYKQLAAKLKELASKGQQVRQPLGLAVTDLCVHDPCTEITIQDLLRELVRQFPAEDTPYSENDKGEAIELAAFWLQVVGNVIAHKDNTNPNRIATLVGELRNVCDAPFDSAAPRDVLKEQVKTALVQQCYHNLVPTAERSVEQALTLREVLIAKFHLNPVPAYLAADDVKLLDLGLAKDNNLWPNLAPIFETCLINGNINVRSRLIALYEKANNEDVARKMEALLATRWKIAGNAKLTQAEKAGKLQQRIEAEARASKVPLSERKKRLKELLANAPLSSSKTKTTPAPTLTLDNQRLLDTMRLTHASTMACILFNKDEAEKARFDEWVGQIPHSEPDKAADAKKPDAPPKPAGNEKVHDLEAGKFMDLEKESLTESDHFDSRLEVRSKDYYVYLRAGEKYVFYMRSDAFKPHLRLKTFDNREQLAEHRDRFTQINYLSVTDGEYRLVASTLDKKALGKFTLHLERQQQQQQQNQLGMFGNLGRNHMASQQNPFQNLFNQKPTQPTQPPANKTKKKSKEPAPKSTEFDDLGNAQSKHRITAFKNLANHPPKEISYREAKKVADFLVPTEWELTDGDLEDIAGQLAVFANYPHVLGALADTIEEGKLTKERAETLVGGLLQQKLSLDEKNYRTSCRKLLVRRALELSGLASDGGPDAAAEFLREMYKEQARAFGLDDLDFAEQAPLASVLETLIKQVAATAPRQKLNAEEKADLEQIDRTLLANSFAADNDLERTVLLQRIWIKVLGLALRERMPASAVKAIQQDLDKKDRAASNLLDQLRFGEENILKLWGLAHNLKVQ